MTVLTWTDDSQKKGKKKERERLQHLGQTGESMVKRRGSG